LDAIRLVSVTTNFGEDMLSAAGAHKGD
jgi:hypothetical protein